MSAIAPIAGVFWLPIPAECSGTSISISHTHGLADGVWTLEGREFNGATQAPVVPSIDFWVAENDCRPQPVVEEVDDVVSCEVWTGCQDDTQVRYCTHSGGHPAPEGWAGRTASFFERSQ